MRKMYVLQGIQGSFKSTFVRDNNLVPFTVSMDTIREMFTGITYGRDSYVLSSAKEEDYVYEKFKEALFRKLQLQSSIIVVDNMNIRATDINSLKEVAEKYNYDISVVQFPLHDINHYFNVNDKRDLHKRLDKKYIENAHKQYSLYEKVENVKHITVTEAVNEIKNELFRSVDDMIIDLNKYKKIHHFGDLQGCYSSLKEYFLKNPMKDDEFYIFVGDLVDRGIENSKTVRFAIENYMKENIVIIKGNHEVHLENYANDRKVLSKEFNDFTKSQIQHISKKDIKEMCLALKDFFIYEYKDKKFFVSHAGLVKIPEFPNYISGMGYYYNDGLYGHDVDSLFTESNKDNNWYQVHGHRNHTFFTILNNKKSFSLEAQIEYGGFLPVLTNSDAGLEIKHIKNNIYKKPEEKMDNTQRNDFEIIEAMKNHDLIRVKQNDQFPYIASFNFTKEAFWDKKFDDELVAKARGLFVDLEDYKIIVRGYDKFFNHNERGIASATNESIMQNFKGPIIGYEKSNGFLGLLGYDAKQDNLLFCSKSSFDTDFAKYFKEIAEQQLGADKINSLKMYLHKHNASAAFEVIDPVRDPHIVEYTEPKVILLDIIYNKFNFEKISYDELKKLSKDLDIEIKQKKLIVQEPEKMLLFIDAKSKHDPINTKDKTEGIVFEDAVGNMVKQKYPYYNFWKDLRGQVSRMAKSKIEVAQLQEKLDALPVDDKKRKSLAEQIERKTYDIESAISKRQFINNIPAAIDFMKFLDNISPEVLLTADIIKLRNEATNAGIFNKYIVDNKHKNQNKNSL